MSILNLHEYLDYSYLVLFNSSSVVYRKVTLDDLEVLKSVVRSLVHEVCYCILYARRRRAITSIAEMVRNTEVERGDSEQEMVRNTEVERGDSEQEMFRSTEVERGDSEQEMVRNTEVERGDSEQEIVRNTEDRNRERERDREREWLLTSK